MIVGKIISGGQSGADRAALDFAISNGIPHGGWCPQGRCAEDGPIDSRYQLTETPLADPRQRTEWNVRDSDGTVIFSIGRKLTGGSSLTADFAAHFGKPCLHLSRDASLTVSCEKLAEFLGHHRVHVLNLAGPRASEAPEIEAFTRDVLSKAFARQPT